MGELSLYFCLNLTVEQRAYAEEDNYSEDDEEDECLLAL